jgi:ABC-type Zn uptake system ZnuABC Zn-binding protein ZnuA
LVTDHTWFSYLARRYGFTQVGAVFPGYSTLAEPSAQELAALEDAIREFGVQAIFVSMTVNPDLAQRVADDTGTRLISLYTASLSEPGGPADDYLSLMRYNVAAIAGALH